jgi:hypothetical protein
MPLTLSPAQAGPAASPATLAVPAALPGDVPFNRTAYSGVFSRSMPGTALRYVTPSELAGRTAFLSTSPLPYMPSSLAPDEAMLDCSLPERPASSTAPVASSGRAIPIRARQTGASAEVANAPKGGAK